MQFEHTTGTRGMTRGLTWIACGTSMSIVALLLLAVGQPIWTDDLWWHLALGAAYSDAGPWLTEDPLAFTTPSPPEPTSWLADSILYQIYDVTGFNGLRFIHVAGVLAILALAWSILFESTRQVVVSSVGVATFAAVATYRLVQLRPHLFSILAMLLLFRFLLQEPRAPSWLRVCVAAATIGLWAHIHAVFPIGPVFLGGSAAAVALAAYLRGEDADANAAELKRAFRIGVAAVGGAIATCFSPMGIDGYSKAFSLGAGGESLAVVMDEWNAFQFLALPTTSAPPSILSWLVIWALILSIPVFSMIAVVRWRADRSDAATRIDPVLVAMGVAGLLALLAASRFMWMVIFPLALAFASLRAALSHKACVRIGTLSAVMLLPGFVLFGDWQMSTRGLPPHLEGFSQPYAVGKYHAPAVWFMQDTGLQGNLFGRYAEGGFQSFWLGPLIRTAMNGALNMPAESLAVSFALRERIGTPEVPRFDEALDRMGVDLFVGTGLPMVGRPGRPPQYSTNFLEGEPGWLLIFRNLDSAVYLRRNERNRANLERVVDYYLEQHVPFDAKKGFDPALVLRRAPRWAKSFGVATPVVAGSRSFSRGHGPRRLEMVSATFLALGMYDAAMAANDALLEAEPQNSSALARRVWLLLRPPRARNGRELERAVRALESSPSPPPVANRLQELARSILAGRPVPIAALLRVPVFTRAEGWALLSTAHPPEIR